MGVIEHTFALGSVVDQIRELAEAVEPDRCSGSDAAHLTKVAAEGERLCAYLKTVFARRAEQTNAWRGGRAASPEQWLADTSGCSEGAVADLLEALEPLASSRFDAARKAERHESHDAYRFDALIDLARDGHRGTSVAPKRAGRANWIARVRVDVSPLLTGHTEPGEVCEIDDDDGAWDLRAPPGVAAA